MGSPFKLSKNEHWSLQGPLPPTRNSTTTVTTCIPYTTDFLGLQRPATNGWIWAAGLKCTWKCITKHCNAWISQFDFSFLIKSTKVQATFKCGIYPQFTFTLTMETYAHSESQDTQTHRTVLEWCCTKIIYTWEIFHSFQVESSSSNLRHDLLLNRAYLVKFRDSWGLAWGLKLDNKTKKSSSPNPNPSVDQSKNV